MSKVVAFKDHIIPGDQNLEIVADIEQLLDEAKSGALTGFAYAAIRDNDNGTGWCGNAGTREALGAAIMMLNHRYAHSLLGLDE